MRTGVGSSHLPAPILANRNPLGGGRDDQSQYSSSGHGRLPLGPGVDAPILAKLYPCLSECIHHRSDGATLPAYCQGRLPLVNSTFSSSFLDGRWLLPNLNK